MKKKLCAVLCFILILNVALCSCQKKKNIPNMLYQARSCIVQYCDAMMSAWQYGLDKVAILEIKGERFKINYEQLSRVTGLDLDTVKDALAKEIGDEKDTMYGGVNNKIFFQNNYYNHTMTQYYNDYYRIYGISLRDAWIDINENTNVVDMIFDQSGKKAEIDNLLDEISKLAKGENAEKATMINEALQKLTALYNTGSYILTIVADQNQQDTVFSGLNDSKSRIEELSGRISNLIDDISKMG